eukprot:TRINITY_DN5012_c0_g1::TRINITY_DN5012_c0_g1_i1::g.24785::m.24785 TRINITY_DN5012_c0_g1::TRINITY_DN5012_c0_g1_i1::g.24785  ORF type:complete len:362 (-),score=-28.31 TRINITY_DN5012_c0_g1_i1:63-1148(-)
MDDSYSGVDLDSNSSNTSYYSSDIKQDSGITQPCLSSQTLNQLKLAGVKRGPHVYFHIDKKGQTCTPYYRVKFVLENGRKRERAFRCDKRGRGDVDAKARALAFINSPFFQQWLFAEPASRKSTTSIARKKTLPTVVKPLGKVRSPSHDSLELIPTAMPVQSQMLAVPSAYNPVGLGIGQTLSQPHPHLSQTQSYAHTALLHGHSNSIQLHSQLSASSKPQPITAPVTVTGTPGGDRTPHTQPALPQRPQPSVPSPRVPQSDTTYPEFHTLDSFSNIILLFPSSSEGPVRVNRAATDQPASPSASPNLDLLAALVCSPSINAEGAKVVQGYANPEPSPITHPLVEEGRDTEPARSPPSLIL